MAEERDVDMQMLVGVLTGVDRADATIDEKIREMAAEVNMLCEVLIETGKRSPIPIRSPYIDKPGLTPTALAPPPPFRVRAHI